MTRVIPLPSVGSVWVSQRELGLGPHTVEVLAVTDSISGILIHFRRPDKRTCREWRRFRMDYKPSETA